MCQQGAAEILMVAREEKEALYQKYEAFQRDEVEISNEELQRMAVRMIMLKEMC